MQEMQVQPLGQEDPLEKGMATQSSIPGWTEEFGELKFVGSQRIRYNLVTKPQTIPQHPVLQYA